MPWQWWISAPSGDQIHRAREPNQPREKVRGTRLDSQATPCKYEAILAFLMADPNLVSVPVQMQILGAYRIAAGRVIVIPTPTADP